MISPAFPDIPLAEFFGAVYRPRRLPGAAPNTIRLYEILLRHFSAHLGRQAMVSDLTEEVICPFLESRAGQRSARTSNAYLDRLMALARYAVLKGRLPTVPDIMPRPVPRRLPIAYTVEQVGQLLRACAETPGMIEGIPAARYWLTVALVLYDTGIRSGACWALRRVDVDLAGRTIFIPAEAQKQRNDQLLRISRETTQAVAAIWTPERELLFPWPWVFTVRYAHWRRVLQQAGLPHKSRYDMFHRLRKTCATLAKRYGADPTFQLGHSSDAVTRRHYLAPEQEIHAADVLPRPWSSVPEITVDDRRPASKPLPPADIIEAEILQPDGSPIDKLLAVAGDQPLAGWTRPEDAIRAVMALLLTRFSMMGASIWLGKSPSYARHLREAHPALWQKVAAELGVADHVRRNHDGGATS